MSEHSHAGVLVLKPRHRIAAPELVIDVVSALGSGWTELSAFDDALFNCGVHNYNLIALSSVIPPCATVTVSTGSRVPPPPAAHGHRLYVVRAEQRSSAPGTAIASGIAWFQWDDGRGLFVEHEASSTELDGPALEAKVAQLLRTSLHDLAVRRGLDWRPEGVGMRTISGVVANRPLCALTLAVFEAEGWRGFAGRGQEAASHG